MGLNWNYSGPDEVYDELSGCMDSMKNITWERLVSEGAVTYPCDDKNKPGNEVIFGEGFPTAIKRKTSTGKTYFTRRKSRREISSCFNYWASSRTLAYRINDIKI